MYICFLSSAHTADDKRVFEKEAVSLAEAGFRVIHLAPGDGCRATRQNVEIITYRIKSGLWQRLLRLPRLYRLAASINADAYHCNEVDSWLVGVALKLLRRKTIVFDVHEDYPTTFLARSLPTALRPFAAAVVRGAFRLLLPFTDRVVLAKQSIRGDYRQAGNKLVLVRNYSKRANLEQFYTASEKRSIDGTAPVIAIHLGLFSRVRGWPQILDAMKQMRSPLLHLHIVGTFNDGTRTAFDQKVQELGLQDRVVVEDWLPFAEAYQRVLGSDIGLVLFQPGIQNHVYALPHKMFDYMAAGLAILIPDFAVEVAPIVSETGCGLLVDSSNAADIARALEELAADPVRRMEMGRKGREAVHERYNWETESARLVAMYNELG